ncbi:MAG: MotA/TolQ/ExbB proton channel family protein [Bradymonadia bacterium]
MNESEGIIESLLRVALLGSEWVLYLLILMSVVSFAVVAERWWWFRKQTAGSRELTVGVRTALLARDGALAAQVIEGSESIEARVLKRAWRWVDAGPEAMTAAIESELAEEKEGLERGLNLLGTVGNNAPFVGLLGTVIGVIGAFDALGGTGDDGNMGNVMAAIAEALVATGVGLFVALPAVVAYNKAQVRIGEVESRILGISHLVNAWLHARVLPKSEV